MNGTITQWKQGDTFQIEFNANTGTLKIQGPGTNLSQSGIPKGVYPIFNLFQVGCSINVTVVQY